jgi:cytochrome c oxidase subunit II
MPTSFDNPRRPGRSFRVARAVLTVPLAALVLTGCDQRFGFPDPATEQGTKVLDLWLVSLYAATALGVLVLGILFYSLIRHRRRNDDLPKQTEGSVPWELTYTIIPFIIVGLLFAYGVKIQNTQTHLSKDPDVRVEVTGFQWNWRFEYRDGGQPTDPVVATIAGEPGHEAEMVLPVGEKVRFNLIAADVNHAFFVPEFTTKRDLIPGVRNEIEVTPRHLGTFVGHCAEYCGLNHSQMNFTVKVVSKADYDNWISQQKGKA